MVARVIANFKALYRHRMLEWLVTKIDASVAGPSGSCSSDPKIDLLKAVRFVYGAWYEVKQATISTNLKKALPARTIRVAKHTTTNPLK